MNRKIGYARVSKNDQNLKMQIDALESFGCDSKDIFTDQVSGSKSERPGLNKCLEELQAGDTLVVWRLDRLGRSMIHLVSLINDFQKKGIAFKSLCDGPIDTTTASGEFVFNIFSSLSQFEKRLIQERTRAGLNAARARGRLGGRKKTLSNNPKVLTAKKMHENHNMSINDICNILKISRATFYRYISL
ncbi:DNA-invertase hin (plasmid) [Rickettsiales bacterium Ac37b]|nr:DNA-invertase hin [Rickettsiales bacterium Ac37b]